MSKVENGWFAEINDLWYGQAMFLEVKKVLCDKKSKYQDILIFERLVHLTQQILPVYSA
jgi:spermidine synthase